MPTTLHANHVTCQARCLAANKKRIYYDFRTDEGRKRVLLIAASILAARKLAQFDRVQRVPATVSAIANAVTWAEEIMKAIDERRPNATNGDSVTS
jgi:hypothetical protein